MGGQEGMLFSGLDTLITEDEVIVLGLGKLIDFLDFEDRFELHAWMVENRLLTLQDVADWLSSSATVCTVCGNDYAEIEIGVCQHCIDSSIPNDEDDIDILEAIVMEQEIY